MMLSLGTRMGIRIVLLAVFVLIGTSEALAQYTTGIVTGIVKDKSGAIVAGAIVTLRTAETNGTRTYKTVDDGNYVFAAVAPGRYEISVEAQGFTKAIVSIIVYSGQTASQDLELKVATVGQTVEVTAEGGVVPTLNLNDPQKGVSRSPVEVSTLPIGTDYNGYATLAPGAVPTTRIIASGSQAGNVVANGARGREVAYQLDYTDANDWEFGGRAQGRGLMLDAIQEFSVLTGNFSAQYGVKSGSQVILVTKSGTNQFHGSGADYFKNDFMNARAYLDRTGKPTPMKSNTYPFTAGGPIIKNKAFLFGGFTGTKTRGAGSTVVALVPTQAAVSAATDPVSISLMKAFLPTPTGSTSDPNIGTITSQFASPNDSWLYVFKFDYRFNDAHSISARYLQAHGHSILLFPQMNTLPGFDTDFNPIGNDVNLSDTYLFGPRTTNQVRFSYGRSGASILPQNGLVSPRFTITGVVGFGGLAQFPNSRLFNVFQLNEVLTRIHGRHTLNFGFDIRKIQDNTLLASNFNGVFNFSNLNSFLTGHPSSWTQLFGPSVRGYRSGIYSVFFQDDWKVRPTLTINLGFREDIQGNMSEASNFASELDPTTKGNIGVAGSGPLGIFQIGNPAIKANPFNLGPRVGFAWNPRGSNLVVRGGYGLYFDSFDFTALTFGRSVPPLNYNLSLSGAAIAGANSFDAIYNGTAPIVSQGNNQVGGFGTLTNFGSTVTLNRNMDNPYVQNWSLGFQYRFATSYIVNVDYVGSKGTHLGNIYGINNVKNGPAPATSVADETARLAQFQASLATQNGPGNTRLDPRFDGVDFQDSTATSIFHSGQIELVKEFTREGLQFRGSYTYSKSIDNASDFVPQQQANDFVYAQNGQDLRNERAVSNFDVPHRIIGTLIWQLPFRKDQAGLVGKTLGGWSFQSIQTWYSGVPATVLAGTRNGFSDVNLDGNGITFVPGVDNTRANCNSGGVGFTLGDPNTIPALNLRGINGAPNSSNFYYTQPLLGNNGTCGRNTLRLNSLPSVDWSLSKTTQLFESGFLGSGPWTLELRWEVYNVFNIPMHTATGNNWRTLSSTGFGVFNSAGATRNMQLVMKLHW